MSFELPEHTVALVVGGRRYVGWESVSIARSIESAGWTFQLALYQGAAASDPAVIRPQSSCVVTLDGSPVITGYVDEVEVTGTADRTDMPVTGRSKTSDLVDCSPDPDGPKRWRNATVTMIAAELAAQYGVDVVAEVDAGRPLDRFALEKTETVYDAIERAASLRSLLVTDDATGRLVLTRASTQRIDATLTAGSNVTRWSAAFRGQDRYSDYICRGQRAASPTIGADQAQLVEGRATDGTSRTRRLVITPEGRSDPAACLERARWEMLTRYGRSTSVSVTVPGWTCGAGVVWPVNRLVRVRLPAALIDDDLLIVSASFRRDLQGTSTDLVLQPAEAFAQFTPPGTKRRGARAPKGYWLDAFDVVKALARARQNQ